MDYTVHFVRSRGATNLNAAAAEQKYNVQDSGLRGSDTVSLGGWFLTFHNKNNTPPQKIYI